MKKLVAVSLTLFTIFMLDSCQQKKTLSGKEFLQMMGMTEEDMMKLNFKYYFEKQMKVRERH